MAYSIPILEQLIDEFRKMPSVGTKSAERMAFYVLGLSDEEVKSLTDAISGVHERCGNARFAGILQKTRFAPFVKATRATKPPFAWWKARATCLR